MNSATLGEDPRHVAATAIAQALYALAISIRDPKTFDSANARSRAALMLVDAFDLVRANTSSETSPATRHPSALPIPPRPKSSDNPSRYVEEIRSSLRQTAQQGESE